MARPHLSDGTINGGFKFGQEALVSYKLSRYRGHVGRTSTESAAAPLAPSAASQAASPRVEADDHVDALTSFLTEGTDQSLSPPRRRE